MAEFLPAFEKMIRHEGGYLLHEVDGDRGGMTYAGIARKFHPAWTGWASIDSKDMDNPKLTQMVRNFYLDAFWLSIFGDEIDSQPVADTIFDFAVNAGSRTAVKLAQIVAGTTPDGVMGPKTVEAVNGIEPDKFIMAYAIAKVARYAGICKRDASQKKFLLGWINRTLEGVA